MEKQSFEPIDRCSSEFGRAGNGKWFEFLGKPVTDFSFSADGRSRAMPISPGQVGMGFSLMHDEGGLTVFGAGNCEQVFNVDGRAVEAKIGVKMNW